jgi:hypothetical protein
MALDYNSFVDSSTLCFSLNPLQEG